MIDSVDGKSSGIFLLMGIKESSTKSSHIGTRLMQNFLISSTAQIVLKLRNWKKFIDYTIIHRCDGVNPAEI
jgi:hypothetical protein